MEHLQRILARRELLIVGAVALGARLAYWALVTPNWVPDADAAQYVDLARSLADGDGFAAVFPQLEDHATAFRPPGLPALLAPVVWISGDALWLVRLVMCVIGAISAVLAAAVASRIAGRRAGLASGVVVALYPPLLANDAIALTEPLALTLMAAAILLALDNRVAWCGAVVGALLLTRPNAYLLVVVFGAWFAHRLGWRAASRFALIAVLMLGAWCIRNQVQVGTPRPTTSDAFTLAAIYSPQAQEVGRFRDPVFDPSFDDFELRLAQFDEGEWSERLTDLALDGIREDPAYVFQVLVRNTESFFELQPSFNTPAERIDGRNMRFRDITLPLFYVVTVVGLAGLIIYRRSPVVWLLVACVGQFAILSLLTVAPPPVARAVRLHLLHWRRSHRGMDQSAMVS